MNATRFHRLIPSLLFCLFSLFSLSTKATAGANETSDITNLIERIYYFEDNNNYDLATARKAFQTGSVKQQTNSVFKPGFTNSAFWLKIDFKKPQDDTAGLILTTGIGQRQTIQAYLDTNEYVKTILQNSDSKPFYQRNDHFRFLSTTPFNIHTSETTSIYLHLKSHGSSYLPLFVVSEKDFYQMALNDTQSATAFYSFSLAMLIVFIIFGITMRDQISLLYATLLSIGLIFLANQEGFAFKYLWPEQPEWHQLSSLFIAYLVCSIGFIVAAYAADKNGVYLKASRVFYVLSGVTALLAIISLFTNAIILFHIVNLFFALLFIAHVITVISWNNTTYSHFNQLALTSSSLLAAFIVIIVILSFDKNLLSSQFINTSNRIVFLGITLTIISTLILHVASLKKQHEQSLANELALTRRDAEKSRELFATQQRYNEARALAQQRQKQLASASHDMKQPLVSLRSSLDVLTQNAEPAVRGQLHNALDYLNNICLQYLADTNSKQTETDTTINKQAETYPAGLLLETVQRMFSAEAGDKKIQLRCHRSSLPLTQPATIVMRVLSNLVANAIKHSQASKLLIGVRRRPGLAEIQVIDNGIGMTPEQINQLILPHQKGPDSEGHGLGLAICQQLATQHGIHFEIQATAGRGCCISLKFPHTAY